MISVKGVVRAAAVAAAVVLVSWTVSEAAFEATNIAGSDGTPSVLNVGSPEVPLIIDKIVGVALSNPSAPGGYWIGGGKNMGSDARIGDTWFQSSATANVVSAADEHSLLLLEATNGGAPGVQTVAWFVRAYQHYDGTGVPAPSTFTVNQTATSFSVLGVGLSVQGQVAAGDKFVVDNSGISPWGIWANVDIDGDGVNHYSACVDVRDFAAVASPDANTSQDFNYATATLFGYEISNGQFALGQFDVTFDHVTTANYTWPEVDRFDVTPEPATLALLAAGLGALAARKRRA